eukprot:TRINITY_DN6135_c0_g1_i8.p1 TRINITY_DN6135_c0_g1~~TRINITY_DN6135_c0_g1_i8.p1  ORF type:complete len:323 (+),score=80.19 TRINITY_DN6135_c0_g1_i8:89-970(+)
MAGLCVYVRVPGGEDTIACELAVDAVVGDIRAHLPPELSRVALFNGTTQLKDTELLSDAGVGAEAVLEARRICDAKWDTDWGALAEGQGSLVDAQSVQGVLLPSAAVQFTWEGIRTHEYGSPTLYARIEPPALPGAPLRAALRCMTREGSRRFPRSSCRIAVCLADCDASADSALGNRRGACGVLAECGALYNHLAKRYSSGEDEGDYGIQLDDIFQGPELEDDDMRDISFDGGDVVRCVVDHAAGEWTMQKAHGPAVTVLQWDPQQFDQPLYLAVCSYDEDFDRVIIEPFGE